MLPLTHAPLHMQYVSEALAAVADSALRLQDVPAALKLTATLHLR